MVDRPRLTRTIGGVGTQQCLPGEAASSAPTHVDFIYHGGPVISDPVITPTFWGPKWADAVHAPRLVQFLKDILASPWMNVLAQYGAGSGAGSGTVLAPTFVPSVAPALTDAQIHTVIQADIDGGSIPEPPAANSSAVVFIFLDESCVVNDPDFGIVMCAPDGDNAFGYHAAFRTAKGNTCYYAVIPALDDACIRDSCPGGCSLSLRDTQEQRRTQVASHELAEMFTDPEFKSGWFGQSSFENGDICNGQKAAITVGANTWNVQRTYSKTDDLNGGGAGFCLASAPLPIPALPGGPQKARPLKKGGEDISPPP